MYNDLLTLGSLTVHGYGLMIGLGIASALLLIWRRAEQRGFDMLNTNILLFLVLVCGFLGAKVLFLLVHWDEFLSDPLGALGSEGFVVYGGIVCAFIAPYIFCRRHGLSFLSQADCFMPGAALAQGFGRIGCFLAGCCYGKETQSVFGVVFPEGCSAPAGVPLWPVQLFSAGGDFLLAGLLLWLDRKRHADGLLTGVYLLLYSIGRFFIEFLRDDPRGKVGFLSTSQFIALFTAAAAVVVIVTQGKKAEPAKEIRE